MAKLTSTVTPQGIVGVSPFLDVAVGGAAGTTDASRSCTKCAIPATPERCCDRPTPPEPGESCSRPARSTSTTRRPCDRPRGRSSICRSSATRDTAAVLQGARDKGMRVLAMDGARRRGAVLGRPERARRLRVRQRGARAARGRPRDGRRHGAGSASGQGGVAQPRGRRHRVPVRVGPAGAAAAPSRSRRSWPRPPTTSVRL